MPAFPSQTADFAADVTDRADTTDRKVNDDIRVVLRDARRATTGQQFLSQARCVDWLLDCLNAAPESSVRAVILGTLTDYAHVRLVEAPTFVASLDRIESTLELVTRFDELELDAV